MNLDLTGKCAVVCGSTQGIGKASAIELGSLGATIILVARNEASLQESLKEIPSHHGQEHSYLIADFSDTESVRGIAKKLQSRQVHILVNNTGGPPAGKAIDARTDDFLAAFQMHLIANQILTQAVVPSMTEAGYGRIINVISTSVKAPLPNLGVSNTIRGAVANWAKTLANELGSFGITVNNVLPGATATSRLTDIIKNGAKRAGISEDEKSEAMKAAVPAKRFATAEELGSAVAFLATPAAAYINGINLPVDGGRTPSL